jgi:hypothetical protein
MYGNLANRLMNTAEAYAHTIIVKKDPQRAIDDLLKNYDNTRLDAIAVYSTWVRTRQLIVRNDDNKDPEYTKHISELVELVTDRGDAEKLLKLLDSPLRDQHRIQQQKLPFLKGRRIDRILKAITPVLPSFYDFKLPRRIVEQRMQRVRENDEARQAHQIGDKAAYEISDNDAIRMIDKAREVILDNIGSITDWYNNVAAIQILSGRRTYEVICSLLYTPASSPYQANVVGIAKSNSLKVDGYEQHTIPLLCPYADFEKAMDRIRQYKPYNPETDDATEITPMHSRSISTATKRLFGRRLNHTQKRNLYAEMAWKRRNIENMFLIGNQSCSKHTWFSRALCHGFNMDTTARYQILNIG